MEKSDLIDKFSNILSVRQGTAEDLVDGLIAAVKEECCSGSQRWEIAADFKVRVAEPQLIQGYTAENWQEIIDGGYLCEFSDDKGYDRLNSCYDILTGLRDKVGFHSNKIKERNLFVCKRHHVLEWKYCRPAQIKGVMRPIFVEPVDKTGEFLFFDDCSRYVGSSNRLLAKSMTWDEIMKDCPVGLSTKYIEV